MWRVASYEEVMEHAAGLPSLRISPEYRTHVWGENEMQNWRGAGETLQLLSYPFFAFNLQQKYDALLGKVPQLAFGDQVLVTWWNQVPDEDGEWRTVERSFPSKMNLGEGQVLIVTTTFPDDTRCKILLSPAGGLLFLVQTRGEKRKLSEEESTEESEDEEIEL